MDNLINIKTLFNSIKNLLNLLSFPFVSAFSIVIFVIIYTKTSINCYLLSLFFIIPLLPVLVISLIKKRYRLIISTIFIGFIIFLFVLRITNIEDQYNLALKSINKSTGSIGYVNDFPIRKNGKLELQFKILGIKTLDVNDFILVKPFSIRIRINDSDLNISNLNISKGNTFIINQKIILPQEKVFNYQYRKNLFYRGIYGTINLKKQNLITTNLNLSPSYYNFLNKSFWKLRESLLSKLKNNLNDDSYGFILSIFFGIRSEMNVGVNDDFRISGMLHLLAISGLHIGFIGGFFLLFFRLFLSKSLSFFLSLIILTFYVLLILISPSSARAYIMYFIQASLFIIGFTSSSLAIISISAIILLFYNPFFLFNVGFQLSFLATIGIVIFSKDLNDILFILPLNKPKAVLSIFIAAFLSLFFVQWVLFERAYIFSILTSIIMIPLFEIIFIILFFAIIFIGLSNLFILSHLVDFIVSIYLKLVYYSAFIFPLDLPKINPILGYSLIPISFILLYLIISNISGIKNSFLKSKKPIHY